MGILHWLFGKHPPAPANPQRAVGLELLPRWQAELVLEELASVGIRATISDHQIALTRDLQVSEGAQLWVMEPDADLARRTIRQMETAEEPRFVLRHTAAPDAEYLVEALTEAIWNEDPTVSVPDVTTEPTLRRYLDDFGQRPGDRGWIAEDLNGSRIGAAWSRRFSSAQPGYGFIGDGIPELAMAVAPGWRNQGVGSALLVALLDGIPKMSLSVTIENPARRLYERFGFVEVERRDGSITMMRTADAAP